MDNKSIIRNEKRSDLGKISVVTVKAFKTAPISDNTERTKRS